MLTAPGVTSKVIINARKLNFYSIDLQQLSILTLELTLYFLLREASLDQHII